MTTHRKGNIRLFFIVAGMWLYLLGYGYEADKEDAASIHSREWVAQQYCGQNSVVRWENDVPQYLPGHGNYAVRVAVLEAFCAVQEDVSPDLEDLASLAGRVA